MHCAPGCRYFGDTAAPPCAHRSRLESYGALSLAPLAERNLDLGSCLQRLFFFFCSFVCCPLKICSRAFFSFLIFCSSVGQLLCFFSSASSLVRLVTTSGPLTIVASPATRHHVDFPWLPALEIARHFVLPGAAQFCFPSCHGYTP